MFWLSELLLEVFLLLISTATNTATQEMKIITTTLTPIIKIKLALMNSRMLINSKIMMYLIKENLINSNNVRVDNTTDLMLM